MTAPIAYAAHTPSCTLFLDEDGVCRQIVRRAASMRGVAKEPDAIARCIGAQYVASIDLATDGGLVGLPKVGAPMLFAYVGESGRIALVRTGGLLRFEPKGSAATPVPKPDSGVHATLPPEGEEDEEDIETQRFTLDAISLARTVRVRAVPLVPREPEPQPERRRGVLPRRRSR